MKNKKILIGALVLVCALLIVLGIVFISNIAKVSPQDNTEIKFGYQPFGSNLAFFVAMDKGFFTEKGLHVTPVNILSANDAAIAVQKGDIIGDATIPLDVLLNIESKTPGTMKIFMVKTTSQEAWSDYLLVKSNSDIKTISDLKGKKIGAYPGSAQQTLLKIFLSKFIANNDFTVIQLAQTVQLQALSSGQVDAILTYDQTAVIALASGNVNVLEEHPLRYVSDPLYGFPYVISTDFEKNHPGTAKKFVEAFYEASDYIKAHPEESKNIMAKWVNIDPSLAQKVPLWEQTKGKDVDRQSLQNLADLYFENKVIDQKIDTSSLYLNY
jgi:NitT/TauT family transport system substrate-binding protein